MGQNQSNPAQASEDYVHDFMNLDEGTQSQVMSKLSPEAKNHLLLGIRALNSVAPAPEERTQQKSDGGWLKGAADVVTGTVKGIKHLFAPDANDHIGEDIRQTYVQGGRQAKEQFQTGVKSIKSGEPVTGGLHIARSGVTAASLANPLATGSVVGINQMEDEGRNREAIGNGAMNILMLWGGKPGKTPRSTLQMNRVVSATGLDMGQLEKVFPEIADASKRLGRAETIGDLAEIIKNGSMEKEAEFRQAFDPVKNRMAYTPAIKNHIDRIIRENPNLAKTPEGRAELASLKKIQRLYDKPWSLEDMNLERSRLRTQIRSLKSASPSDARARVKLDREIQAKQVVANSFSETVNDHLAHVNGKTREYYDILRQKQEAFIDLNDHMTEQVSKLRTQQAAGAGKMGREKANIHAYMSKTGPRATLPLGDVVSEGVGELADAKVKSAFQRGGPNRHWKAARTGVMALPLSHLLTAGQDAKKSRLAPPPSPDE